MCQKSDVAEMAVLGITSRMRSPVRVATLPTYSTNSNLFSSLFESEHLLIICSF